MLRRRFLSSRGIKNLLYREPENKIQTVSCKVRYYSIDQVKKKHKKDIEDWIKTQLREPLIMTNVCERHKNFERNDPITKNLGGLKPLRNQYNIVKNKDFEILWKQKFKRADPDVLETIISLSNNQKVLFSIEQLLILAYSLHFLRNDYDIGRIYNAYEQVIPLLASHADRTTYGKFIEIMLIVQNNLQHFNICETLFSDYIKYCRVNPQMISLGLTSFTKNNNIQLAVEFYTQAITNPDTFPITEKQLFEFLRCLQKYLDISNMKHVFFMWLKVKCSDEEFSSTNLPSIKTLTIMHRMFLRHPNTDELRDFLTHPVVVRTGYASSVQFDLVEFCHSLYSTERSMEKSIDDLRIKENVHKFVIKLNNDISIRRELYMSVVKAYVSTNNFSSLKNILEKIQNDKYIDIDGSFHLSISRYFVNTNQFEALFKYYFTIIKNGNGKTRLRPAFIQQLWSCAVNVYPMLTKEITNDILVTLRKDEYGRRLVWLYTFLQEEARIYTRKINGGEESSLSRFNVIDFERFEEFKKKVSRNDVYGAESVISNSLKDGIAPQFCFLYAVLELCLSSSLTNMAHVVDKIIRTRFCYIPIKVDILWLKWDVVSSYRSTEKLSAERLTELEYKIKEFERTHQLELSMQNYLQLTQICFHTRDFKHACYLISQARKMLDTSDNRQWMMYYMTSLKLAARMHESERFSKTLKDWNCNQSASLITPGCIRQIKGFMKYFEKRSAYMSTTTPVDTKEIKDRIDELVVRYADYKFQGLENMRKLTNFLKEWFDEEILLRNIEQNERKKELLREHEKGEI
ncbi:Pet111p [Saccharomyces eubayanus]|uniref:Pet111p n=1 Tax=Saccharomyces eubayanus TaxID=1080349 RepID=UPI0006BF845F|nr:PET111-like protein [Saccharomyces eubayanus]KOG97585.1 PET111-like protein [Saccharomyces eubayanus]